jgi:hypothetical protein
VNRRSGPWIIRILFTLALVAGLAAPQHVSVSAASDEPTTVVTTVPDDDIVIDEANPFLPENRDLTDCVGMLQRPGCGSEARGGWHQNAVAIVMITGLLIVFGRVAWGVRRSQKNAALTSPE